MSCVCNKGLDQYRQVLSSSLMFVDVLYSHEAAQISAHLPNCMPPMGIVERGYRGLQ